MLTASDMTSAECAIWTSQFLRSMTRYQTSGRLDNASKLAVDEADQAVILSRSAEQARGQEVAIYPETKVGKQGKRSFTYQCGRRSFQGLPANIDEIVRDVRTLAKTEIDSHYTEHVRIGDRRRASIDSFLAAVLSLIWGGVNTAKVLGIDRHRVKVMRSSVRKNRYLDERVVRIASKLAMKLYGNT